MKMPKQAQPVKRPQLFEPYKTVNVVRQAPPEDVESLLNVRFDLLHGANYNDPAQVRVPVGYDCHIFSGTSMAQCLAAYSLL